MLWRESWTVRGFCILILLATFGTSGSARVFSTNDALILRPSVTGVLDTLQACWSVRSSVSFSLSYSEDSSSDTVSSTSNGALLGGDAMGAVAASSASMGVVACSSASMGAVDAARASSDSTTVESDTPT